MIVTLYLLAIVSLLVGTAAIYMAFLNVFPVEWLYYHYFLRKPVTWFILAGSLFWVIIEIIQNGQFPSGGTFPLLLMGLSVVFAYKFHQSNVFRVVDYPHIAKDASSLPLEDDMEMGVIEYEGVTRAYPLDYVIHHHIINDRFGSRIVALTYCAMCRSIIPFDVTGIGPLFVGSFKNANMIVADRKTKTFFQQATFESIIGKLHPSTLKMIPYQILPWSEVKKLNPVPQVLEVTKKDLAVFELPIPGLWKKLVASEMTPGLPSKVRDTSFSARTRVIGVIDPVVSPQVAYLKDEVVNKGGLTNSELGFWLVPVSDSVLGFKCKLKGYDLNLDLTTVSKITDSKTGTAWDVRGKYMNGPIESDLEPIAITDEYWFAWRLFHPGSRLIRL